MKLWLLIKTNLTTYFFLIHVCPYRVLLRHPQVRSLDKVVRAAAELERGLNDGTTQLAREEIETILNLLVNEEGEAHDLVVVQCKCYCHTF